MLQAWIPLPMWYFSGNAVGWCLSDFMFFYFSFPFIFRYFTTNKKIFILTFIFIIVIYTICIIPIIPVRFLDAIIYINPLTRLIDFVIGIILWGYIKNLKIDKRDRTFWHTNLYLQISLVIIMLAVSIVLWYEVPNRYNLSVLWWPAISLLLIFASGRGKHLFENRLLVNFGNISFSFYLIHGLVINTFDIIINHFSMNIYPITRLLLILITTTGLAYLIHHYFVIPAEKAIRKYIF